MITVRKNTKVEERMINDLIPLAESKADEAMKLINITSRTQWEGVWNSFYCKEMDRLAKNIGLRV